MTERKRPICFSNYPYLYPHRKAEYSCHDCEHMVDCVELLLMKQYNAKQKMVAKLVNSPDIYDGEMKQVGSFKMTERTKLPEIKWKKIRRPKPPLEQVVAQNIIRSGEFTLTAKDENLRTPEVEAWLEECKKEIVGYFNE